LIAGFICPKSATSSCDGICMKINTEFENLNLSFKIFVGQNLESCQLLEMEKTVDGIVNFIKFEKSKEESFSNYFEKTKFFKKIVTVLVSNQQVAIQFSGVSYLKNYSKIFDNTEVIAENETQFVKNIGSRKRFQSIKDHKNK
jgi:hypothetical protein